VPTKRIVCLANSRKLSGRCVAGRVLVDNCAGEWVRPVSARPKEEVSEDERQYEDGGDPRVLDVIEVPLLEAKPKHCQRENWLLDPNEYWRRVGRLDWCGALAIAENPERLWVNESSTQAGLNDEISFTTAQGLTSSLVLIHVNALRLHVLRPGRDFGNPKLRVQGRFEHRAESYWLWVTDPGVERAYKARGEGEYDFGECCLTISIGDEHEGNCYKLIAAIIPKE
jgi:hypothetical protein